MSHTTIPGFLAGMLAAFAAGCCLGPEHLSFSIDRHGSFPDGTPTLGSSAPRWGSTETVDTGDALGAIFSDDDELDVDALALYDGDGARVMLASERREVETNTEACAHRERSWSLAALQPGDYTLVHVRARGTGDPLNCGGECPWTPYGGEEALTLTLAVR